MATTVTQVPLFLAHAGQYHNFDFQLLPEKDTTIPLLLMQTLSASIAQAQVAHSFFSVLVSHLASERTSIKERHFQHLWQPPFIYGQVTFASKSCNSHIPSGPLSTKSSIRIFSYHCYYYLSFTSSYQVLLAKFSACRKSEKSCLCIHLSKT